MMKLTVLLFLFPLIALGEDLRAKDGTIYRQAKVSEVAADGLIVSYEKGMAKIDFDQLPKALQDRYGYEPRKATRLRAEQARIAQQTATENQRLIKAHEERVMEKMRKLMDQSGEGFTYRADKADAALARQVGALVDAEAKAKLAAARVPATFWNAPLWKSPLVQVIGGLLGGGDGRGQPRGSNAGDGSGFSSSDPANH
jgi:hypothetical protein